MFIRLPPINVSSSCDSDTYLLVNVFSFSLSTTLPGRSFHVLILLVGRGSYSHQLCLSFTGFKLCPLVCWWFSCSCRNGPLTSNESYPWAILDISMISSQCLLCLGAVSSRSFRWSWCVRWVSVGISFVALLWTFSNFLISFFKCGCHACIANSIIGYNRALYSGGRVVSFRQVKVALRQPSIVCRCCWPVQRVWGQMWLVP